MSSSHFRMYVIRFYQNYQIYAVQTLEKPSGI